MSESIEITRGDDKSFEITVVDASGAPVNLTGLTGTAIRFTARAKPHGPAVVAKQIGAGITITDGPAGKFKLDLAPADTTPLGNYRQVLLWDVQVVVTGLTSTVLDGRLVVGAELTY